MYYFLRLGLLHLLFSHPSNHLLKISSLLFPQVCSRVKEEAERTSSSAAAPASTAPVSTPRFNAKRSSIFMTPSLHKALALQVQSSPPSAVTARPAVPRLPLFETWLDPPLLLLLVLRLSTPLLHLLPLRLTLALYGHVPELVHDLFLLSGYENPSSHSNFDLLSSSSKAVLIALSLRQVLLLLGWSDLSSSILSGFGYGSLLIGYGLKELITDLLAGVSLFFSRTLLAGHKIEVFGKQAHVVRCGMRNVELRLIRDGEVLVVPNSRMVREAVTVYGGWEERRCGLNFVLDSATCGSEGLERIKARFRQHLGGRGDVRLSEPCIYLTGMRNGWEVECCWYLRGYYDEISKFKNSVDGVVMNLITIFEEEGVKVVSWLGLKHNR